MARLNFAALIVIMITAGCVSDVPQMASDGKPALFLFVAFESLYLRWLL